MLKKLLFGAGAAYLANKFMGRRGGRRHERSGGGLPFGLGGSRRSQRGAGW